MTNPGTCPLLHKWLNVEEFSCLLYLGRFIILHPNAFMLSSLKAIEKAIVNSDLGVTPNNDGDVIRLSLPPLTSERRKVSLPGKLIKLNHLSKFFKVCDFAMCIFNVALPFNCTTAGTI